MAEDRQSEEKEDQFSTLRAWVVFKDNITPHWHDKTTHGTVIIWDLELQLRVEASP